jgi:hypothetical protein
VIKRRFGAATAAALIAVSLLNVTGTDVIGEERSTETGFCLPFSGSRDYEYLAPTQATNRRQINQPIGLDAANFIAEQIRLDPDKVLTPWQLYLFITGQGRGGDPEAAKVADESVRIFNNTTGTPLFARVKGKPTKIVLGSYGLYVTEDGWLQSLAVEDAPTRKANYLLVPPRLCPFIEDAPSYCGYIDTWFRKNGARDSLQQLYKSEFTEEAAWGFASQSASGTAQLVPNTKGDVRTTVGMSMAPSIWLTNFALLYTLDPKIAAKMPAYWEPIPENVVRALKKSPRGRVRFSRFESEFKNH